MTSVGEPPSPSPRLSSTWTFPILYFVLTSSSYHTLVPSSGQNSGYCLAVVISFVLGSISLMPFYILVQPIDYYAEAFPTEGDSVEILLTMVYLIVTFVSGLLLLLVPYSLYRVRITLGAVIQAISFALIPSLTSFDLFLYTCGLLAFATSLCHGSMLYLSAQLPGSMQRSVSSHQHLSSLLSLLFHVLSSVLFLFQQIQVGMGLSPLAALSLRIITLCAGYSNSTFFYFAAFSSLLAAGGLQGLVSLPVVTRCLELTDIEEGSRMAKGFDVNDFGAQFLPSTTS